MKNNDQSVLGFQRNNFRKVGLAYLVVLVVMMSVFTYQRANAMLSKGEPTYCDSQTFGKNLIKVNGVSVSRLKAFQIGSVVIAGMAIGNSDANNVLQVAQKLKKGPFGSRHCTWYLNKGNNSAEREFMHRYVPNPSGFNDTQEAVSVYMSELGSEFADSAESFVACAERAGYVAMGCNGQRHRGPTVFGMMLAYSGCTPQNAATIVNELWGLNGIKPEIREGIIRAAYEKGNREIENRNRIQQVFLTPAPK